VWSAAGDGTFSDATDEFAVYTPGENDILNGSVVITATATGSCAGFTDAMMLKFNPAATVDAGSPLSACDGAPVTLSAVLGGSATSLQWTSSGDGTFDDPTLPNATYTPGDADMTNGSVTLTATTNNPPGPCASTSDQVVVTTKASVTALPLAVCANAAPVDLTAYVVTAPAGGIVTFTGAGVSGDSFDPAGTPGAFNIQVDYDFNGCLATTTLAVT